MNTARIIPVILSGGSGRTVTTCEGWASKTSQATTTTADPTVQEEGVIATRPAERTSTTLPGSGDPLAEATPVSTTTTTGSTTTTTAVGGQVRDSATRAEAMALLLGR